MNYNGNNLDTLERSSARRIGESCGFGQNTPEKKFSTGAIQATVWRNAGKSKTGSSVEFMTVSFTRRYKDKEGNWQSTNSLRVADLPKALVVLNEAYRYAVLKDNVAITEEYVV